MLVHLVHRDPRGLLASQVSWAILVIRDQKVPLGRQVHQVPGSLDPEVRRETRAALFPLQKPSSLDPRDPLDLTALKDPRVK